MRPVTRILIILITGFYFADRFLFPGLTDNLQLINHAIINGQWHGVSDGEYWRILTVALTHGSFTHLFFNMYALLVLGNIVESSVGKARYLTILFIAQIGASLASLYFNAPNQGTVGASGAIFGLFGALLVISKKFGFETKQIYLVIAINFGIGFILPNIDWHAHLGGLIAGALAAADLTPTRR